MAGKRARQLEQRATSTDHDQAAGGKSSTDGDEDKVALKRELSLFVCVMIIVGNVVGSGIFISPKGVLLYTKSVGLSLVVWALAGVIVMLGGLSYAELGTTFGKSGGTYTYIREAFGPMVAFLVVWNYLLISLPIGGTILSLSFARYVIKPFFPNCEPDDIAFDLIALAMLAFIYFVNCWKVTAATSIQNIFTVAKVIVLLVIIAAGIVQLSQGKTEYLEDAFDVKPDSFMDVSLAFYQAMFAFSGWPSLNVFTEELKNPLRDIPVAIVTSITIITLLYVMANVAYFTVMSPAELLSSSAVGVTFADYVFGSYSWTISICVAFSIFGTAHSVFMAMARVFFATARDGHLPATIGMVHIDYRTPMPSLLMNATLILIAFIMSTWMGVGITSLLTYSTISSSLFLIICFCGMIYLRLTRPDLNRPFKVPLVIPITYLVVSVYLLITGIIAAPIESGIGFAIILTGIPAYYFSRWNKPSAFYTVTDAVGNFIQKSLFVVSQEKKTY